MPSSRSPRRRPRKPSETVLPKSILAKVITNIIEEEQLTQLDAAIIVRDAPSQISLIVTGKITGISNDRMLRMLLAFGRDIEIITRPAKGKTGRVTVKS